MRLINLIYLVIIALTLYSCEKTEPENASISTAAVKNITASSAESGGIISSDGKLPVLYRGTCWGKNQNPTLLDSYSTDSIGVGSYSSKIIDINAGCKYYARAYFINSNDTVFGNQIEFTTSNYITFNSDKVYGSVTDIDGNVYKTITIGTQTWLAENLKTTHFQNGETISNETDLSKWGDFQISTSAYCWYKNDISNKDIYGAMYNWHAVSDIRNIAPAGWHVASVEDWQTLSQHLGGYNFGNPLRENTTAHWLWNKSYFTTNQTGFTALPVGKIASLPFGFMDNGELAYFWTKTGTLDGSSCIYVGSEIAIDMMAPNCRGFSVRCVKD
jgi:uncharacterized protein (TIGR02145 family)